MNFGKFLRTPLLKNTFEQQLLSLLLETPNCWVFFLLLIFPMFIYWSLSLLGLYFLSYLSRMVTMQIHFDSHTVFTYACHWISRYLVLFFLINELSSFEFSEYFILNLGKTLINCILIKSSPQSLRKQNQGSLERLCSDLVVLYELLKWQGINHSYLRKLLEW